MSHNYLFMQLINHVQCYINYVVIYLDAKTCTILSHIFCYLSSYKMQIQYSFYYLVIYLITQSLSNTVSNI